jgi:hypothetical protein
MQLVKPRLVVGLIIVTSFFIMGFVVPFFAPKIRLLGIPIFATCRPVPSTSWAPTISARIFSGCSDLVDPQLVVDWAECRGAGHGDRRYGGSCRRVFWAAFSDRILTLA